MSAKKPTIDNEFKIESVGSNKRRWKRANRPPASRNRTYPATAPTRRATSATLTAETSEVKWRLLWLRCSQAPARFPTTEIVQHNEEGGFALPRRGGGMCPTAAAGGGSETANAISTIRYRGRGNKGHWPRLVASVSAQFLQLIPPILLSTTLAPRSAGGGCLVNLRAA